MADYLNSIMLISLTLVISFVLGFYLRQLLANRKIIDAKEEAKSTLIESEREASNLKREFITKVKGEIYQDKIDFFENYKRRERELVEKDKKVEERFRLANQSLDSVGKKERELSKLRTRLAEMEKEIKSKEGRLDQFLDKYNLKLEKVAGVTSGDVKKEITSKLEKEAEREATEFIRIYKDEITKRAELEAKRVVDIAVGRPARKVKPNISVVYSREKIRKNNNKKVGNLSKKIIEINAILENATQSGALASFDPIKRELARARLEKLLLKGKVKPDRVNDVADRINKDVESIFMSHGKRILRDLGLENMHPDLISILGRLNYRTSYGQNNLEHSKEVAFICGAMAAELGYDVTLAKRAALLHDIGKALDREDYRTHVKIGIDLARKYDEHRVVVNSIEAHHDDAPHETMISVLVQASDAMSGGRPGARRDTFTTYVERLEKLENIAQSFNGVKKVYAIQGGRELRIMVDPNEVSDDAAAQLSGSIAQMIENELVYPGQIKIVTIREIRAIGIAS